jgi:hypothetical protein
MPNVETVRAGPRVRARARAARPQARASDAFRLSRVELLRSTVGKYHRQVRAGARMATSSGRQHKLTAAVPTSQGSP